MARGNGRERGIYFQHRRGGEVVGPKHVCTERGCHGGSGGCQVCASKGTVCIARPCLLNGEVRGEWWVVWFEKTGKRHREKAGTKSMALELYQDRKSDARREKKFPENMRQGDVSLREIASDYLDAVRGSRVKTARRIERRLAEALAILGPVAANAVGKEDLERLKLKLGSGARTVTRKAASVNRYLQDLKAVYFNAMASDSPKVERTPFFKVKLLKENNKRTRELTPEEEFRLFHTLPSDPPILRPYFRFLLETGARAGEACQLRWAQIRWADGGAELPETKAGETQYLTLSRAALALLKALPRNGAHVFCWPDGRPLTVDYTTHAFHKATVAAGIPNLRQHDLRHGFAIRRLRGGANLVAVSGLLRHASTRMTERYLHLTRADLRAAVETGHAGSTATSTATEVEALLQAVESDGTP